MLSVVIDPGSRAKERKRFYLAGYYSSDHIFLEHRVISVMYSPYISGTGHCCCGWACGVVAGRVRKISRNGRVVKTIEVSVDVTIVTCFVLNACFKLVDSFQPKAVLLGRRH